MPTKRSSAWNPTRRNRNIGMAWRGFKPRTEFRIPWGPRLDGRLYWEKLNRPVKIPCVVGDHRFAIYIEPTRPGYSHHVTVDDIIRLFSLVPASHRGDIGLIILRQPKRKERIFAPVWGRLIYYAQFEAYKGPAIIIEAQPAGGITRWSRSLSEHWGAELASLRAEGHVVTSDRRSYRIESSPAAIRNTQLYRTLLHEIGHYVDYIEKVLDSTDDDDSETCSPWALYHARPSREKEEFAEAYAQRLAATLKNAGAIPFDSFNAECSGYAGLDAAWFAAPADEDCSAPCQTVSEA